MRKTERKGKNRGDRPHASKQLLTPRLRWSTPTQLTFLNGLPAPGLTHRIHSLWPSQAEGQKQTEGQKNQGLKPNVTPGQTTALFNESEEKTQ